MAEPIVIDRMNNSPAALRRGGHERLWNIALYATLREMDDQIPIDDGSAPYPEYEARPTTKFLREAAFAYGTDPHRDHLQVVPREESAPRDGRRVTKMKTSVYLERTDVEHLAWLSRVESRPQAEIIRDAIRAYQPQAKARHFHIFGVGEGDGRSIVDVPEDELMRGFGADAFDDLDR